MKGDKTAAVGEVTVRLSTTMLKVPLAMIVIAIIVFTILIAPQWLTDILSGAKMSFTLLVSFPSVLALALICILLISLSIKQTGEPDVYGEDGIKSGSVTYPWWWVSCLYVNHNMNHMVLLFKGLTGPTGRAGFIIPKLRAEPSPEALIKLAEAKGIRIEHREQISRNEFLMIWSGWAYGDPERAPSEVLEEQGRQTFVYMVTHWPEIGVLAICSAAVIVLIPYVFLALLFLSAVVSGSVSASLMSNFLCWSVVLIAVGIPALLAFRYWRKWSGIPPPREPPTV